MRVTGPEGLDETYEDERDAVLRALDWAGFPIEDDYVNAPLDVLYERLEWTLGKTGEVIWVREDTRPGSPRATLD